MLKKEKKLTALMLVGLLALMQVTACGSGKNKTGETKAAETKAEETKAAGKETEKKTFEGTEVSTSLFSLTYADDWTYNEDETSDSDSYCYVSLSIPDGDTTPLDVSISASVEDAFSYRDDLHYNGIDAYELVEEKSIDTVNVGGVECVECETTSWGVPQLLYMGRDEASGTTVSVSIYDDYEDIRVKDLVDSITFSLEDTGNVDPPWPWNGEAFSTDATHTYGVGSKTVTSEWLKLDDYVESVDIFSGRVEAIGDTVWVLMDNVLYEYEYKDGALNYISEKDLSDEGDYEELSSDSSGRLYVSGFMEQMLIMEDGEIVTRIDNVDSVLMHPSGTWGISSFYQQPLEKVTLNGESASVEEWPIRSTEETSNAFISQNHVYVTGVSADKDNQTVWVYDTEGNQQFEFGNAELGEPGWMGSVSDVVETENGFIVLDGNVRTLFFYGTDGSLIAEVGDGDLFGTFYPWISSATVMSDGSVLVALVEEREDESAYELLLYRLSGF